MKRQTKLNLILYLMTVLLAAVDANGWAIVSVTTNLFLTQLYNDLY